MLPAHSFALRLSVFLSLLPAHRPPATLFPSSLLFSWSLHSTPPLQTGHKRAERATPDLWQTFQSSRPFHTGRVPYPSSSVRLSVSCPVLLNEDPTNRRACTGTRWIFLETSLMSMSKIYYTFWRVFWKIKMVWVASFHNHTIYC